MHKKIHQPEKINDNDRKQKIQNKCKPERADPDENIAQKRKIPPLKKPPDEIGKRDNKKNYYIPNFDIRTPFQPLKTANENIKIDESIE